MRIVLVNSNRRLEGGVETYLNSVVPALHDIGYQVSLCHEVDLPPEREPITLPAGTPTWCVSRLGMEQTISAVRDWRPDVVYVQNVSSAELERKVMDIAPAVFFAHDYSRTCISGSKTFQRSTAGPCDRRFGWQCLLHFYPKRCGGLNPVTMFALYGNHEQRLELIKRSKGVITHSHHMQAELIRNGIPAEQVFLIPFYVRPLQGCATECLPDRGGTIWRLAFAGRTDDLKGGRLLLDAVRLLAVEGRQVHVVFAGDGPARQAWEAAALPLCRAYPHVRIEFPGWLGDEQLSVLFRASDLFVMPSIWPEPFGTVGVQAAAEGLPSAAFAVGGIREWLIEGVTGHLAPGTPPSAEGLAGAIGKCLIDKQHYSELCGGAAEHARRFTSDGHIKSLDRILQAVAG